MKVWGLGMVNSLLRDIEENKGNDSMYITAYNQTCYQATQIIKKAHPDEPSLTSAQVKRKIEYLASHGMKQPLQSRNDLFREGRSSLRHEFDEDILLQAELDGQKNIRRVGGQNCVTSAVTNVANHGSPNVPFPPRKPELAFSSEGQATSLAGLIQQGVSQFTEDHEERCEAINTYLTAGVESAIPSPKELKDRQQSLTNQIRRSIQMVLDAAVTGDSADPQRFVKGVHNNVPMLLPSFSSPSFLDLCQLIYDASSKETVCQNFGRFTLRIKEFLGIVLAAAIFKWVFSGDHDHLPLDPNIQSGLLPAIKKQFDDRSPAEEQTMVVSEDLSDQQGVQRVNVSVFPAILERIDNDYGESGLQERTMVHAVVLLQRGVVEGIEDSSKRTADSAGLSEGGESAHMSEKVPRTDPIHKTDDADKFARLRSLPKPVFRRPPTLLDLQQVEETTNSSRASGTGDSQDNHLVVGNDDENPGETGSSTRAASVESKMGPATLQSPRLSEQAETHGC
ncbi:MAG: hypothetical protein Q9217_000738 [Psora testacea]